MNELKDKIAIVTGAGRGIGKAIALKLAEAGANVVVSSRTLSEIEAVSSQIEKMDRKSFAVRADISIDSDVKNLVSQTVSKYGTVDILINNAGIGYFAHVAEMKAEEFDKMWEVNVRGAFLCTQTVLPFMTKQNSGDIVNIASLAGRNSFVGGAGYSATKWALIGFGRSLMLEVRKNNIRVVTVCPGSVDTQFTAHSSNLKDMNRIPKADDIAQVVINALQMPRNVMVSEIDVRPTNPS